ncbi:MAG: nucleotide exchange factor GrpE [Gudongella sp.]|nr:nucleotide exchange factor GrpE [Gudongella sp.]
MTIEENNLKEEEINTEEVNAEDILQDIKEEELILNFKNKIKEKEQELGELQTRLTRLQADFQNYKRRTENDKAVSVNYGIEIMAIDILPVLDNFQRALSTSEDKEDLFYKGVSLIEKQFIEALAKNNVKEIEALGKDFDPKFHHAVSTQEGDEEKGIVIDVLQKGYEINEKVIRPAMVIVSQ